MSNKFLFYIHYINTCGKIRLIKLFNTLKNVFCESALHSLQVLYIMPFTVTEKKNTCTSYSVVQYIIISVISHFTTRLQYRVRITAYRTPDPVSFQTTTAKPLPTPPPPHPHRRHVDSQSKIIYFHSCYAIGIQIYDDIYLTFAFLWCV